MSTDLIGKVVRWSGHDFYKDMWFTARVEGTNTWGGYTGFVVDPGNWSRDGLGFSEGQFVPNMREPYMEPIDNG